MMNKSIELYKVKREIKMHGSEFTVKRNKIDEYKEPTGEQETITAFRGLFHITKTFQTRTVKDGTVTLDKGIDYTLKYKDNINAGTATVIVVPTKGSEYDDGTTASATFEITPDNRRLFHE